MQPQDESKALVKHFNSRSRKVAKVGNDHLVPLKYSEDGEILTQETFDVRQHLKHLNLNDWRFLEAWRRHGWSIEKASKEICLTEDQTKRLVKKLECFKAEEARDRALAAIPSNDWIKARHVQNFYEGGTLDDSEHKSLQELAKIEGAYKNNLNVSVTQNVFNLPKLDPETEAKLKAIASQEAQIIQEAQIVNG